MKTIILALIFAVFAHDAVAQVFSDPHEYCRAVGTVDNPEQDDRYRGPWATEQMEIASAFGVKLEAIDVVSVIWRCSKGEVLACWQPNRPQCERANTSRKPVQIMVEWCQENPNAQELLYRSYFPENVSGGSIFVWKCVGKRPVAGRQFVQVDSEGYPIDSWKRIPRLQRTGSGSVITLDGVHILSILNPNYNSTSSDYLKQAIDASWTNRIENNIGPITQFGWAGNIYETDTYVTILSALLEKRTKENSRSKAKLVVLAHSWGTVLSYLAISKNKKIVVDRLVTLGSPLNAQNSDVNSFTKERIGRKLKPLSNVKVWNNYWADCDPISGKISVANNNFIVAPKTIDIILVDVNK